MMNSNEERMVIDLSGATNITELGIKITAVLESDNAGNKDIFLNLGKIDLKQSQLLSIKALVEAMQSKLAGIETLSEMTETAAIGLGLVVGKAKPLAEPTLEESFKLPEETPAPLDNSTEEISSFSQLKKMNSIGDFVTDTKELKEFESEPSDSEAPDFHTEVSEEQPAEVSVPTENIYDSLNKTTTPDDIQDALDATFGAASRANIPQKTTEDEQPVEDKKEEVVEDVFAPITMSENFEDFEITELREKSEESKYVLLDTEGITPEGIELIKSNTSDMPTLYLTQTLRSGQTVSYEGNIFLIGDAHPGSEINATGDVTIWGILGGIVHAGYKGNTDAKVRALKLNPIQLRIANLYSRRNDTVNVPYVQKSNEFTPEEARIENEQIVIYKTLRRED